MTHIDTVPTTRGTITTPILTFENPAGRTVTLIGLVHAATPRYYLQVEERITALEEQGARVHVERVRNNTPAELKDASRVERRAVRALMTQMRNLPQICVHVDGVIYQGDGLSYPPRWENHDLDKLSVVRIWGPRAVRTAARAAAVLLRYVDTEIPSIQRRVLIAGLCANQDAPLEQVFPPNRVAVEKRREQVALDAMDTAFTSEQTRHVVLVWGAGHVPGLSAGLVARGFEPIGEQRLTVLDLDRLPDLTVADACCGVKHSALQRRTRARILANLKQPTDPH